jgi:hypothetical protein
MQESVYNPILDALADHKPKTLGQLEEDMKASDDETLVNYLAGKSDENWENLEQYRRQ